MNHCITFIFIFSLSLSTYAQNSCKEIFKTSAPVKNSKTKISSKKARNANPIELSGTLTAAEMATLVEQYSGLIENVSALRKRIGLYQLLTGDSARQTQFERQLREKEFNFLINNLQNLGMAIDKAQRSFIDVEANYIRLNQIYKDIREGRTSSFSADQILEFKKDYANSFGDYFYIRTTLEELAYLDSKDFTSLSNNAVDTNPDSTAINSMTLSKEKAKYLLNKLGIPTLIAKKDSAHIKRPSIEELSDFFKEHPELLLLKIQNDLKVQKIRTIKLMPLTLLQVENIQAYILKFVPRHLKPIVGSFFALNYNHYVLKTYLPNIMKVLDSPNDSPLQRLTTLHTLATEKNTLEFLTTFARISLYTKTWVELKGEAEKLSKDSPLYLKFYNQMQEAEAAAVKSASWLHPFYKPALVDYVRVWAGSVTFWLLVYWLFADDEETLKLLKSVSDPQSPKPTTSSDDIKWPQELSEVKRAIVWMLKVREWVYSIPKP